MGIIIDEYVCNLLVHSLKMPTMNDVAKLAGVSQSTVSRVLNTSENVPMAVAPETRRRVQEAMEELGYRPNLSAQAMKNRRSGFVGVLLENRPEIPLTHYLAWEFVLGINEELERSGHIMSLVRLTDVQLKGGLGARALQSHLLDGLIAVNLFPTPLLSQIGDLFPHTIWLDANVWHGENCLRRDEEDAGAQAVKALADFGFSRVLFIRPDVASHQHFSHEARFKGACDMALRLGLGWQVFGLENTSLHNVFETLRFHLSPDVGLIIPDSYLAQALVQAVARSPLQLGQDVHYVCCDDHFQEPASQWGMLGRITFNRFEMGRQAVQMMIALLDHPGVSCPSRLVRGEFQVGLVS